MPTRTIGVGRQGRIQRQMQYRELKVEPGQSPAKRRRANLS